LPARAFVGAETAVGGRPVRHGPPIMSLIGIGFSGFARFFRLQFLRFLEAASRHIFFFQNPRLPIFP